MPHEPHCPVPRAEARGEGAVCQCGKGFLATKHVATVKVVDPDTGEECEVEIRKIEGGPLVGLDQAYLEDIGGVDPYEEYPVSPYDGKPLHVPDDEC